MRPSDIAIHAVLGVFEQARIERKLYVSPRALNGAFRKVSHATGEYTLDRTLEALQLNNFLSVGKFGRLPLVDGTGYRLTVQGERAVDRLSQRDSVEHEGRVAQTAIGQAINSEWVGSRDLLGLVGPARALYLIEHMVELGLLAAPKVIQSGPNKTVIARVAPKGVQFYEKC